MEYTDSGELEKLILPDGAYLQYGYDTADRLDGVTDNLGNQLKYALDQLGNPTLEETFDVNNVLVQKISQDFDEMGRLNQSIGAGNQVTEWSYDAQGNEKTLTDPLLQVTVSNYDALNRLESITDPSLESIAYTYDTCHNLSTVTDPRGLVTSYDYNGFDEQVKLNSPDSGQTDYSYDEAGNMITKTDSRSESALYVYDSLNRLELITYSDEVINFIYDQGINGIGRLSSFTDSSGQTSYTYDSEGRVNTKTQITNAQSFITAYDYNINGQLAKLTTPSGNEISYGYRADGKVVSVSINGVEVTNNIEYFPFGEMKSWVHGSGFNYQRSFDLDGRIDDYTQGSDVQEIGYDLASRITSLGDNNQSWDISYDQMDRLSSADKIGLSLQWDYDATGNRLYENLNGVKTDYIIAEDSNQLIMIENQSRFYDATGNLIDDGILSSTYSGRNRLIQVQDGSQSTFFQYNAFGERVSKQSDNHTLYTYDEAGYLLGEYDATGNLIQEIVWIDETPIAVIRPDTEPHSGLLIDDLKIFFIHPDHLDTPRSIVDSNNQTIWQWHFDPFGTSPANENPDGNANDFVFNLRFPGQYLDIEVGTHYNYFRDYEPLTGRYLQSDPIGITFDNLQINILSNKNINFDGVYYNNLYQYVLGSTLTNVDFFGLAKKKKPKKKNCNACASGRKGGANGTNTNVGHRSTKKGSKKRTKKKHQKCRPGTFTKARTSKSWYQR